MRFTGRTPPAWQTTSWRFSTSAASSRIQRWWNMRAEHIHTVSLASLRDDTEDTLVMAGRLVRGDGADWTTWWSLVASMPRGPVNLDLSAVTAIDAAGAGQIGRATCRERKSVA